MSKIHQVDVVFPTRNRLSEALVTIQKIKDIGIGDDQIHIGDDCSDPSLSLTIRQKFPGVNVISNRIQSGQLHTRNQLFKQTGRKYILSIDDDSHLVSRDVLEEAIELLEKSDGVGIFGFRALQQLAEPPARESLDKTISRVRTFIACGALIRRDCLDAIGNYTREELGYYCEEIDCSIRAYKAGFHVLTKNDLVVHHRVNRNYQEMPRQTDGSKGIYGAEWRSIMGFSDNLIVTLIYFPFGFDIIFFGIYVLKRFFLFTIKYSDYKAFLKGLLRTFRFFPYIVREKDPMTYGQFIQWIRLPMM